MLDTSRWAHRSHRGPKTEPIVLTADQRAEVEAVLRQPSTPHGVARRAQALLLFADAVAACDVARALGVDDRTVFKWRARFRGANPVSRLTDAPRPGRPVSLFHRPRTHA